MMTDETQCAEELRKGSYKAFTRIYEAYADALYGFAVSQLHDTTAARDIVQDAFLKLWVNRSQVNCLGNMKGFIFSIARFRILDHFRHQLAQPTFEEYMDECANAPTYASPEEILMYDEFLQCLARAKERLTPRERQIFDLSREHRLTSAQIAAALGLSEQTVKNHLTSALQSLRTSLAGSAVIFSLWL